MKLVCCAYCADRLIEGYLAASATPMPALA